MVGDMREERNVGVENEGLLRRGDRVSIIIRKPSYRALGFKL